MAYDPYQKFVPNGQSFGRLGNIITPSNSDLGAVAKAVVCLTAGNLTIIPADSADGNSLAFVGVPAGFIPPYQVRRVTAATATVATIEN